MDFAQFGQWLAEHQAKLTRDMAQLQQGRHKVSLVKEPGSGGNGALPGEEATDSAFKLKEAILDPVQYLSEETYMPKRFRALTPSKRDQYLGSTCLATVGGFSPELAAIHAQKRFRPGGAANPSHINNLEGGAPTTPGKEKPGAVPVNWRRRLVTSEHGLMENHPFNSLLTQAQIKALEKPSLQQQFEASYRPARRE
uniref:Uncharacterized protein n=1 Tax=Sphaerodactylus townsendi TaxID=933632 RepID=A0ACB8FI53_9SAUR